MVEQKSQLEILFGAQPCQRCQRQTHSTVNCHAKYDTLGTLLPPIEEKVTKTKKDPKRVGKKVFGPRNKCYFYDTSTCLKSNCPFSHDFVPSKQYLKSFMIARNDSVLCKYYRQGGCEKGSNCLFSHDLNRFPCVHHHLYNNCLKSDCKWSHSALDDRMKDWLKLDQQDYESRVNKQ